MKLVPENINEAIKHLSGRPEDEIENSLQKILDDCGYKPNMKKDLLKAIKLELADNRANMRKKLEYRKPVNFLSNNLYQLLLFIKFDFKPNLDYELNIIEYLAYDLKKLIEKYNLNK